MPQFTLWIFFLNLLIVHKIAHLLSDGIFFSRECTMFKSYKIHVFHKKSLFHHPASIIFNNLFHLYCHIYIFSLSHILMGVPDIVFHTHVSLCISIYIYLYVFQYVSVKEFLKKSTPNHYDTCNKIYYHSATVKILIG